MSTIRESIERIRERILAAELRSGRPGGTVKLMAVSKFHGTDEIREAARCGVSRFGENRVRGAAEKFPAILADFPEITLHMIGTLQRNKVRQIVPLVSCIQSVDRSELITEIEKQAAAAGRTVDILFEYHTGEQSKSGFMSEDELSAAVGMTDNCPHIRPRGFMTMAPFVQDTDVVRRAFRTLAAVAGRMRTRFPGLCLDELSMGMSGDFEIAVEEGSTLVRIGTAVFGERGT